MFRVTEGDRVVYEDETITERERAEGVVMVAAVLDPFLVRPSVTITFDDVVLWKDGSFVEERQEVEEDGSDSHST